MFPSLYEQFKTKRKMWDFAVSGRLEIGGAIAEIFRTIQPTVEEGAASGSHRRRRN